MSEEIKIDGIPIQDYGTPNSRTTTTIHLTNGDSIVLKDTDDLLIEARNKLDLIQLVLDTNKLNYKNYKKIERLLRDE